MLPLDCIGEIIQFLDDPTVFLKVRSLSKNVMSYVDDFFSSSRCNIVFKLKNSKLIQNKLSYVKHLLIIDSMVDGGIFKYFPNLKKLELEESPNISQEGFSHLGKLKKLSICDCHQKYPKYKWDGEILKMVSEINSLELSNCAAFRNSHFGELKKLKKLTLFYNTHLTDEIFRVIPKLEVLRLEFCRLITPKSFPYLKDLKKLTVYQCYKINVVWMLSLAIYSFAKDDDPTIKKYLSELHKTFPKMLRENFSYTQYRFPSGDVSQDFEYYDLVARNKRYNEKIELEKREPKKKEEPKKEPKIEEGVTYQLDDIWFDDDNLTDKEMIPKSYVESIKKIYL